MDKTENINVGLPCCACGLILVQTSRSLPFRLKIIKRCWEGEEDFCSLSFISVFWVMRPDWTMGLTKWIQCKGTGDKGLYCTGSHFSGRFLLRIEVIKKYTECSRVENTGLAWAYVKSFQSYYIYFYYRIWFKVFMSKNPYFKTKCGFSQLNFS